MCLSVCAGGGMHLLAISWRGNRTACCLSVCLLRDCPLEEEEEEITGASNLPPPQSVIVFHFDAT